MASHFQYLLFFTSLIFSLSVVLASPFDPHIPRCSNSSLPFFPRPATPCPWFEGWYVRISDPEQGTYVGAIIGTIPSTGESMITLLACHRPGGPRSCQLDAEGSGPDSCLWNDEAQSEECQEMQVTHVVTKDVTVTAGGHPVSEDPSPSAPPSFEWRSAAHGFLRVGEGSTQIHLTIGGVSLEANLTNQVPWKANDLSAGPMGWGKYIPFLLPCQWYVHSLGSSAVYLFGNSSEAVERRGKGWGHEEKNWGRQFPTGHIWAQATSPDGSIKVVLAAVYMTLKGISSPFLISIGYRSPTMSGDFLSPNPLNFFPTLEYDACKGDLKILAHSLTHTLLLKFNAPPRTFGPKLLAATENATWAPLCQESFAAKVRIKVWSREVKQTMWDRFKNTFMGRSELVTNVTFGGGALEFGEKLMCGEEEVPRLKASLM